MKLVIVESPTKAKTIQQFLGKNYNVQSSFGHIRDLPKSKLGIDVENDFEPSYLIPAKAKKIVKALKKEAENAESVILATDEDREGEAIAFHLKEALKLENPERIVFHEITKSAIEEALQNPRHIDMDLVNAQQARRILDRLVGYKLSPFLWKKVARRLSAGRVQSVAVRLVVDREKEIRNFKAEEYWSIIATLFKSNDSMVFEASLTQKDGKAIPKLGVQTKKDADKILKDLEGSSYKVEDVEKKETKKYPLPPFTTSTLQQAASQKFRYPAKMCMLLAGQLYETGLITYHRTDSLNLAQSSLVAAKDFILNSYGNEYWAGSFKTFKTKSKRAQEAHEAIRPTNPAQNPEMLKKKLNPNQFKMYDLIWRRFVASQMNHATFDATTIDIQASNPDAPTGASEVGTPTSRRSYTFHATGQMLKFDGFLKIYPMKFEEANLPSVTKDEILKLRELTSSQHFTQPPPRYNEATLIKTLEAHGIGRPSTYAPTLSTIQERNYIDKDEQRRLVPTEIGEVVNDLLVEHFPEIVDIDFTAEMEDNLDKIAEGEKDWVPMIQEFYNPFEKNLEQKYKEVSKKEIAQETTDKVCPNCGKSLIIRLGKYGKFYACSGFPECKYTESLEKDDSPKVSCPKCEKGNLVHKRTKKKKIFYGCDQYPNCDYALWDKPTGEKCKQCNSLLVEKGKQTKCSDPGCETSKK